LEVAVEAVDVYKRYGSTIALKGVTLKLEARSLHVILGPNGSGKSTLLSIIAGAEKPDRGSVRVLGLDPWRESSKLSRRISALLDKTNIYPWATGLELLKLQAAARGLDWSSVEEIASRLGVTGFWGKPFISYSSGMRRRLLITLALAGSPELVVLDEPFQALDREAAGEVSKLVVEAYRKGSTVIVATHIVNRVILEHARTVTLMEDGRVAAHGEKVEVGSLGDYMEVGVKCVLEPRLS